MYNRFHKQDTYLTPREKVNLKLHSKPLLMSGKSGTCRRPGAQLNNLDTHWSDGIWLGRDSETNQHFFGTEDGIVRAKAIRRMVEAQQRVPARVLAQQGLDRRRSSR